MVVHRSNHKLRMALTIFILLAAISSSPAPIAATSGDQQAIAISLLVFGSGSGITDQAGRCYPDPRFQGKTILSFGQDRFIAPEYGILVAETESPVGIKGCLFEFDGSIEDDDQWIVRAYGTPIGELSSKELGRLGGRLEIAIEVLGQDDVVKRSEGWRFERLAPRPTPSPKPTRTPSPTETPVPSRTPSPTRTPTATATATSTPTFGPSPTPTNTLEPTKTPLPTSTPLPSPTPVPTQAAGPIPGTDDYLVRGTFVLFGTNGDDFYSLGSEGCVGIGGYSDIAPGKQIIVRNQSGDIVATAALEPDPTASATQCSFVFEVEVPDATFYSFEMGRRGELAFSKSELESSGWEVEFSLGL